MTLFLDFDGVLHPLNAPDHRQFVHLATLESVLQKHPQVEVVISSTWRQMLRFEKLRDLFSPVIRDRVVGVTPHFADLVHIPDRLLGYPREAEINAWMTQNRQASNDWVALDDSDWLFYPFCPNLIHVDAGVGLTSENLQLLDARLSAYTPTSQP